MTILQATRHRAFIAIAAAALVLPTSTAALASGPGHVPAEAGVRAQRSTPAVSITEGTDIAAAVSPDHKQIIFDLQGDLYGTSFKGGEAHRLNKTATAAALPDWSPKGDLVAFQSYVDNNFHIVVMRPDGSHKRRVTQGKYDNREPRFSPDGTKIAFSSDRGGSYNIWVLDLSSGHLRQWTTSGTEEFEPTWSPDGTKITFISGEGSAGHEIKTVDASGHQETLVTDPAATLDSPSWSPDGKRLAYTRLASGKSKLVVSGNVVSGDEDVFPFPVDWTSNDAFVYTADGHLVQRDLADGTKHVIPFKAKIRVSQTHYRHKTRNFDSRRSQRVKGIVSPVVSPDGNQVAFVALNDLWVMRRGQEPQRVTHNAFTELQPTWSPDGKQLAYSSDKSGTEHIYIRDMHSGREHRLTAADAKLAANNEFNAVWCPHGDTVAFMSGLDGHGTAITYVADTRTGGVRQVLPEIFEPGRPTWGPGCKTLALAAVKTFSNRFRQGTNQILTVNVDTGKQNWVEPVPFGNISDRTSGDGPVWSPDGKSMAFVKGSVLWTMPVTRDGQKAGALRQVTKDVADYLSWTGDSRHLMYLSNAKLRMVSKSGKNSQAVRLKLDYKRDISKSQVTIHAGNLWDGTSRRLRHNVDIVVRGNRIVQVQPHRRHHHGRYIDASKLTVMPGLIEAHMHREWVPYLGSREGRELLAYGITSTMSMGDPIYRSRSTRESVDAGAVVGPRAFTNAEPINGSRTYYAFMRTTTSEKMLRLELSRHRALDTDILKTYVRLPNNYQKEAIRAAHRMGIGAYSHYFYPSMVFGQDGMSHLSATQRLGYSRTLSHSANSYEDVVKLAVASKMSITATPFSSTLLAEHPEVLSDPRIRALYTDWQMKALRDSYTSATTTDQSVDRARLVKQESTLRKIARSGGVVMAGTDEPLVHVAYSLHETLGVMVRFGGWTPYEALRAATAVPADRLGVGNDLGTVESGKLADMSFVRGNPLKDIGAASNVHGVMQDGHFQSVSQLIAPFKQRQIQAQEHK